MSVAVDYKMAAAVGEEAAKPEPIVQGGLLGAISSSIDDVQDKLDLNEHLVDAWRLRANRASKEANQLVDRHAEDSFDLLVDFALLSLTWLNFKLFRQKLNGVTQLNDRQVSGFGHRDTVIRII